MIRFRNPGTQYTTQVQVFKELYKEYKDAPSFDLDDMASTIKCLISANRGIDFRYIHRKCGKEFALDTAEIKKILGDIPLDNAEVYIWLSDYLSEGEGELENLNE